MATAAKCVIAEV